MRRLLEACCGGLAATALFAIMGLTLVDVTGRKLAASSLPGAVELTEMLMLVVIFAGLPLVTLRGEHVVFDSLDAWLPTWWRHTQEALIHLLCALALSGAAWLMWHKAVQLTEFGDKSASLGVPQAPFVFGMAMLCAITAAVHLAFTLGQLKHRDDKDTADEAGAL